MRTNPERDGGEGHGPLPPPLPSGVAIADPLGGSRFAGRRLLCALVACSAVLFGLWVVHRFDPARSPYYPQCWFHGATGWHCPGCGTLRGLHALSQGDLPGAVRRNALVFGVVPAVLLAGGWMLWRRPDRLRRLTGGVWIGWTVLILTLLFGILRNLPFRPFSILAP